MQMSSLRRALLAGAVLLAGAATSVGQGWSNPTSGSDVSEKWYRGGVQLVLTGAGVTSATFYADLDDGNGYKIIGTNTGSPPQITWYTAAGTYKSGTATLPVQEVGKVLAGTINQNVKLRAITNLGQVSPDGRILWVDNQIPQRPPKLSVTVSEASPYYVQGSASTSTTVTFPWLAYNGARPNGPEDVEDFIPSDFYYDGDGNPEFITDTNHFFYEYEDYGWDPGDTPVDHFSVAGMALNGTSFMAKWSTDKTSAAWGSPAPTWSPTTQLPLSKVIPAGSTQFYYLHLILWDASADSNNKGNNTPVSSTTPGYLLYGPFGVDTAPPTAMIEEVDPDPTGLVIDSLLVTFTEDVSGVDIGDFTLTLNGGGNLLTGSQTVTSEGGTGTDDKWTVGNLAGLTANPTGGTYTLTLVAGGSGIQDRSTRALTADASEQWTYDVAAPEVKEVAGVKQFTPRDDATDVAVDTDLIVQFTEHVQAGTGKFYVYRSDNTLVQEIDVVANADKLTIVDDTVTIDINDLSGHTGYYIKADSGAVKDLGGANWTGIADTTTWNYTTVDLVPVGVADGYTVAEGGTLTVDDTDGTLTPGDATDDSVLLNDTDADGDPLTVSAVNGSGGNVGVAVLLTSGTVTVAANGTFTYVHDGSEAASDSFTYKANDGQGGTSGSVTVTITITSVNDAPVITKLPGDALAYTEDDGLRILDQGDAAEVTDADSANFDLGTLTVEITVGGVTSEDTLAIKTGVNNITLEGTTVKHNGVVVASHNDGGANGSALVVTFNLQAPAGVVQDVIRSIGYENTNTLDPTGGARTVRYTLTDGDGGTSNQPEVTVTVSAGNDAPVVDLDPNNNGGNRPDWNATATEGVPVKIAHAAAATTDEDDDDLKSMTITLTNPLDGASEALSFTPQAGLTAVYAAGTGVLSVTADAGQAPEADFTAFLRSVQYENTSADPTLTARVITVQVTDPQDAASNTATATISITAVNDRPWSISTTPTLEATSRTTPPTIRREVRPRRSPTPA